MATRLYDHSEFPARPLTLDSAYAQAYGQLRGLLRDICDNELEDYEYIAAKREQIAVRLEKSLRELIYDPETVRVLARPPWAE